MCFSNDNNQKTAKTATKNIRCLKGLDVSGDKIVSPYFSGVKWKKQGLKKSAMRVAGTPGEIDQGLHSAQSFGKARYHASKVFPAVIPKGARYWDNGKEYVSNQLKITSETPLNSLQAKAYLKG